jgi:foldase protein PrsA
VTKDVKVPDAEAQKYYDDNKATYTTPESRDVRHILVAKKALAEEIRKELVAGADFAALAKKYSTDPGSKDAGGKYTVTKGQTVPPFEKASFSLKTNEISQPVKTQFGYHIIQPTGDLKQAAVTPFAKVKAQIVAQLLDTKKQAAMSAWQDETDKKFEKKVSYADGYAPPAAATTPVTTADES